MRSTVFSRKCCKTAEITDFRLPELSFPAVFYFCQKWLRESLRPAGIDRLFLPGH